MAARALVVLCFVVASCIAQEYPCTYGPYDLSGMYRSPRCVGACGSSPQSGTDHPFVASPITRSEMQGFCFSSMCAGTCITAFAIPMCLWVYVRRKSSPNSHAARLPRPSSKMVCACAGLRGHVVTPPHRSHWRGRGRAHLSRWGDLQWGATTDNSQHSLRSTGSGVRSDP